MEYLIFLPFVILLTFTWMFTAKALLSNILVQKNDIVIAEENGLIRCDQTICPKDAFLCHVLKEADAKNGNLTRRINTCYSKRGVILFQGNHTTLKSDKSNEYLDLTADRDGLIVTNEEIARGLKFSSKNLLSLHGKNSNYIKSIADVIAETRKFVTNKISTLLHKR